MHVFWCGRKSKHLKNCPVVKPQIEEPQVLIMISIYLWHFKTHGMFTVLLLTSTCDNRVTRTSVVKDGVNVPNNTFFTCLALIGPAKFLDVRDFYSLYIC